MPGALLTWSGIFLLAILTTLLLKLYNMLRTDSEKGDRRGTSMLSTVPECGEEKTTATVAQQNAGNRCRDRQNLRRKISLNLEDGSIITGFIVKDDAYSLIMEEAVINKEVNKTAPATVELQKKRIRVQTNTTATTVKKQQGIFGNVAKSTANFMERAGDISPVVTC